MCGSVRDLMILTLLLFFIAGCGGGKNKPKEVAGDTRAFSDHIVNDTLVFAFSRELLAEPKADTVSFGDILSGDLMYQPLRLKNVGDIPLVILDVSGSCDCVELDHDTKPLQPGEEMKAGIRFNAAGLKGTVYKKLDVRTNLSDRRYILVIKADVD